MPTITVSYNLCLDETLLNLTFLKLSYNKKYVIPLCDLLHLQFILEETLQPNIFLHFF